jgi:hypothetical protein
VLLRRRGCGGCGLWGVRRDAFGDAVAGVGCAIGDIVGRSGNTVGIVGIVEGAGTEVVTGNTERDDLRRSWIEVLGAPFRPLRTLIFLGGLVFRGRGRNDRIGGVSNSRSLLLLLGIAGKCQSRNS